MAVLRGLELPAETVAAAEAFEQAAARLHEAAQEAQGAQVLLEAALKPYTVSSAGADRARLGVRRLGLQLESQVAETEFIVHDTRHVAGELRKARIRK